MDEAKPNSIPGFTFLVLFFQLLLSGLDDLALRSLTAWKWMDFFTPVLGIHPFDIDLEIRLYIYGGFALLCSLITWIPLQSKRPQAEKFICRALSKQYRTHVAFCICAWIHVSARLVAGGNWFFVCSISSASIASVSAFMSVASSRDSLVLASWVMAQSTAVAVIFVFHGYFCQAAVSIFPILPSIYAMHNSGRNENSSQTAQMVTKVVDTVDMSASMAGKRLDSPEEKWVYLKDIEEGEGLCSNKSNA